MPEPIVFFVDRSLGRELGKALIDAGAEVRLHDDIFAPDVPDQNWLEQVGQYGWVVLTKDKNIRLRRLEIEALIAAKVRAFVLTSGNLTGEEMSQIFVRNLSKIIALVETNAPPFIAKVTRTDVVELYL